MRDKPLVSWTETLQTYAGPIEVTFMRLFEKAGFYFDFNGERYGNCVNLETNKRMLEQWEIITNNAIETYEYLNAK